MVLGIPSRTEPPRPKAQKHGPDQFAERRCVDWVQLVLLAVSQVMVVQCTPREADTLCGLVIIV